MTIRSLALSALPVFAIVLPACSSTNPSPSRVSTETVAIQGEGSAMLTRDTYSDTDVVDQDIDSTWEALGPVYEALEIPITHRLPQDHVLGNLSYSTRSLGGERMSRWLYCGRNVTTGRPHADTYDVRISVRTELSDLSGEVGGTGATTWVEGSARSRGASGDPVNCTTTGDLEDRVLELLQIELARREAVGG